MNLSASAVRACRERDGDAAKDRPEQSDAAMRQRKRVGFGSGLPLVDSPEDVEAPALGEDVSPLYDHYPSNSDVLLPEARDFLASLFDAVSSIDQAEEETKIDAQTLAKAADLHGLDEPSGESDVEADADGIRLPNGETWEIELLAEPPHTDPRILTQLLATDKLGVDEAARYLSREVGEPIDAAEVRAAAEDVELLDGPGTDGEIRVDRRRVQMASQTEYSKSPWE
jgi:hypothetical protein